MGSRWVGWRAPGLRREKQRAAAVAALPAGAIHHAAPRPPVRRPPHRRDAPLGGAVTADDGDATAAATLAGGATG
jgi:hypothetical protein